MNAIAFVFFFLDKHNATTDVSGVARPSSDVMASDNNTAYYNIKPSRMTSRSRDARKTGTCIS